MDRPRTVFGLTAVGSSHSTLFISNPQSKGRYTHKLCLKSDKKGWDAYFSLVGKQTKLQKIGGLNVARKLDKFQGWGGFYLALITNNKYYRYLKTLNLIITIKLKLK